MTAGHNGTTPPEGDDPFGYLYRQEGGAPGAAPQQGVPRTSYQQVRPVGERRYGTPQGAPGGTGGYGYPPQNPQAAPGGTGGYGYPPQASPEAAYPNAHYAAPETQPGGRAATRGAGRTGPAGHGGGGGQRRNGLLIAALAVVGAVLVGVGAAVAFSGDDNDKAGANSAADGDRQPGSDEPEPKDDDPKKDEDGEDGQDGEAELPTEDASSLRLDNGPVVAGDIPGSRAEDGKYVAGLNKPGATVTWTTEVPEAGTYRLYYGYTVPGKDMKLSLQVNDAPKPQNVNFKNFAKGPKNDWEKSWTHTYGEVRVEEGTNTFRLTCAEGDSCDVAVDQVWLTPAGG
ncbi:carbohydrate-binding protein [Streptomyces chumphonensis]|uniref:carbohydrate-binding protein n=1 Tax=Streptomyces chumphonensis TaxID=1214925 RepID=UPI003D74EEDF